MARVQLRSVGKAYDTHQIIKSVDLNIEDGEFCVFVGPSGCGKSTLLRMIAGLEDITNGELLIGDVLANTLPPAKRGVAMVFQSYALYPHMSVYDNMAFGLKLAGKDRKEIKDSVLRAAGILQLDHLLDRKPKQLSGGQRQRVAIGRAIVRQPEVFLFDEPLSNLDASLRVQMRIEIAKLHKDLKATMVYVTHDQVEAMTLADKIVVINKGNVEQIGAPLELYNHPQNLFVAGFIGSPRMNFVDCRIVCINPHEATVVLPGGSHVTVAVEAGGAKPGDEVILGIRPEHLVVSHSATFDQSLSGRVEVLEHLGDETFAYLDIPGTRDGLLTARLPVATSVQVGDTLTLNIPKHGSHLFAADQRAYPRVDAVEVALAANTHALTVPDKSSGTGQLPECALH
ncbi:sn-glycerol-3-phosphate ABC transporter ATP-binding protein UgpC [Pseudomonas frederiksbergensis]|uniref:ABC transporter ATP-binding protein n=1 Tax=Pseudomonas frederiksbergensis TaxID=104087 RepID=UPI00197DEB77|nr:sn-glycerol-3-phosphate ABC transporter ATP-binding protein UgpC [Pseudomonas frederiksbergensis]MBN3864990.1 sn-glycerol-3-phosphate ABC transporter ATP-binding protein UgpC [Pseudomonas frederiksbergensis]